MTSNPYHYCLTAESIEPYASIAQQFVEKALKGILSQRGFDPPRTHDLQTLFRSVTKTGKKLDMDAADLEFLSGIYIEYRYPSDLGLLPSGMPDEEDGRKAEKIARTLFDQIKEMLQ